MLTSQMVVHPLTKPIPPIVFAKHVVATGLRSLKCPYFILFFPFTTLICFVPILIEGMYCLYVKMMSIIHSFLCMFLFLLHNEQLWYVKHWLWIDSLTRKIRLYSLRRNRD